MIDGLRASQCEVVCTGVVLWMLVCFVILTQELLTSHGGSV